MWGAGAGAGAGVANVADSADTIAMKIRKAKTDSNAGFTFDREGRPEKSNLLGIYAALTGASVEAVCEQFQVRRLWVLFVASFRLTPDCWVSCPCRVSTEQVSW